MINHLTRNNLIATEEHGFLAGKPCITNLLLFMDSLTQARDSGLITDSIFFDFAKAFDKVPHQPPIHKLQEYGITGKHSEMDWIIPNLEDFLSSGGIHSFQPISDTLRGSAGLCPRPTPLHDPHKRSPSKHNQPVAPLCRRLETLE